MAECANFDDCFMFLNSFDFTNKTYRKVFYLHMRPHEVVPGLEMTFSGLFYFVVMMIILGFTLGGNDGINFFRENLVVYVWLFILFFFYGFLQLLYGLKMTFGLRRPKWGTERWNLRESLTMEKLSSESTATPIFEPCVVDFYVAFSTVSFRFMGGWWTTTWDNSPYLYDEIPHCVPTKKELSPKNPEAIPEFVTFSTRFYEEYMLKGTSDKTKYRYGDIFDIVEYKKIPNFALIRMRDKETEILIKTDAFDNTEWLEVRDFILTKQKEQKKIIKEEKKEKKKDEV